MPDPLRKTISATEASGLFNVSPYVTRWMLWQRFAKGVDIDSVEDSRMTWGKRLQPLILAQAAEDLKLEVIPNVEDSYVRRGLLGCTRDATIICPDRGPGALETKAVFDYRIWMQNWDGGKVVPQYHEIQLQQQILVGAGSDAEHQRNASYEWGVIAAWVCGDMYYFERKPIEELWRRIEDEAESFFASVTAKEPPDPFGASVEVEWLTKLLPTDKGKVIDMSADDEARGLAQMAMRYVEAKENENAGARLAQPLRAKLLALAGDAEEVWLPGAIKVKVGGNEKSKRLSVHVPEVTRDGNFLMAG